MAGSEIVHLKMNDNAASTVVVDTGSGATNGTLAGGDNTSTITTTGKINSALNLNGTDDRIDLNQTLQSTYQSNFSVTYWMNPDDGRPTTQNSPFGNKDAGAVGGGSEVSDIFFSTGKNRLTITIDGVKNRFDATNTVFADGAIGWQHVAWVIDWSLSQPTLYVNGSAKAVTTVDNALNTLTEANLDIGDNLTVGARNTDGTPDSYLSGSIDDFRVFDGALTAEEVYAIHNKHTGTETALASLTVPEQTIQYAGDFTRANSEDLSITDGNQTGLDIEGNNDLYMCAWVRADSIAASASNTVFSRNSSGQNSWVLDYLDGSNNFRFFIYTNGGSTAQAHASTFGTASTNTWYFLQAYHDATNDVVAISVNNGTFDTTAVTTGIDSSTATIEIGGRNDVGSNWDGRIQNVAFYSAIPSSAVRDALYNSGAGIAYNDLSDAQKTNLVSWWALDERTNTRYDLHGSNDLTDNNTVTRATGIVPSAFQDIALNETSDTTGQSVGNPSTTSFPSRRQAQGFQVKESGSGELYGISINIENSGLNQDWNFRLETDSSGDPSSTLVSGTVENALLSSDVPSSAGWLDLPLGKVELVAGTTYWLYAEIDNESTLSNFEDLKWLYDSAAGYTDGDSKYETDSAVGTWNDNSASNKFKVWGTFTEASSGGGGILLLGVG